MPHPQVYKVPSGFEFGLCHAKEIQGDLIKYFSGEVAEIHERLVQLYGTLAGTYNKFAEVDSWLKGVGDRAPTDLKDEQRREWWKILRDERDEVVEQLTLLLKAGADLLPPDPALDRDVAAALEANKICDAAIAAAGVQQAHAKKSMDIAIRRTHPELIKKSEEYLNKQKARVMQLAAQAQERANVEAMQLPAQAQDRAKVEANLYALGPSGAVAHRHKEADAHRQELLKEDQLRRQRALDKLKADRVRRQKSPQEDK